MSTAFIYNEKELLQRTAEGDEAAFAQLYKHWQPAVSAFIFRISRSKEVTAEIVQDVFLKIWMTRETLAAVNNFKSYLFIISRNHAINAFKKHLRENKELNAWLLIKEQGERSDAPDIRFSANSLIDEAIDKLSPRQKEIYLMHRHERLSYKEIAQKLGIGRESVKTHLQLAVKAITAFLKAHMLSIIFITTATPIFF